ncbi:hypothetical protein [Rufibacter sp. LB8]|uniref:hypothetical protein n=1 Tax=Rufibacter sp. LB8 TaxID=2777781 RepID=UPI00178C1F74|nr:hypothetical protein [Rufibacter sp. LB8]
MKKMVWLAALLVMSVTGNALAQKKKNNWQVDKVRFGIGSTVAFMPFRMQNYYENEDGEYEVEEKPSKVVTALVRGELSVPVYRADTWSVGVKTGVGVGLQGVPQPEGDSESVLVYDFPQFAYYRNYATPVDFSLLLGYKYSHSHFSTHFGLAGVEVKVIENVWLRLYGALNTQDYQQLTRQEAIPAPTHQLREFGLTVLTSF